MKKTDIAMIVLIASVSVLVAFFVARSVPVLNQSDGKKPVMVKTADVIEPNVVMPPESTFNKDAINPTIEVTIGGESSQSALRAP